MWLSHVAHVTDVRAITTVLGRYATSLASRTEHVLSGHVGPPERRLTPPLKKNP